jgi:hypothetical protein
MKFTDDAEIASWAYDAMAFAAEDGIFSGVGGNRVAPLDNATREQALTLVNKIAKQYKYIDGTLEKSTFNYISATRYDGFWVPKYDKTPLRSYDTNEGVTYKISYLVDSYDPQIALQQEHLINILYQADPVSYPALLKLRELILSGHDSVAKRFNTQSTLYINPTTGSTSSSVISKPYFKLTIDTELTLEYIK